MRAIVLLFALSFALASRAEEVAPVQTTTPETVAPAETAVPAESVAAPAETAGPTETEPEVVLEPEKPFGWLSLSLPSLASFNYRARDLVNGGIANVSSKLSSRIDLDLTAADLVANRLSLRVATHFDILDVQAPDSVSLALAQSIFFAASMELLWKPFEAAEKSFPDGLTIGAGLSVVETPFLRATSSSVLVFRTVRLPILAVSLSHDELISLGRFFVGARIGFGYVPPVKMDFYRGQAGNTFEAALNLGYRSDPRQKLVPSIGVSYERQDLNAVDLDQDRNFFLYRFVTTVRL